MKNKFITTLFGKFRNYSRW